MIDNSALRPKFVMIATVVKGSSLDMYYVHSLADTIKIAMNAGIVISPMFITDDQSVPMAKNELLRIAHANEVDSVVFLDRDLAWDAGALVEMIASDVSVGVLPVVAKKMNNLIYDIDFDKANLTYNDAGYLKISYASTACMKLDRSVITALYDSNVSLDDGSGNDIKMVFEHQTQYGTFFNEHTVLCNKLKDLGIPIWALPSTTCAQHTNNLFTADFPNWLATMLQTEAGISPDVKSLYE